MRGFQVLVIFLKLSLDENSSNKLKKVNERKVLKKCSKKFHKNF